MYHPAYVQLSDEEEKKFQEWHDVKTIDDCLDILRVGGYEVDPQSNFRIVRGYLMEFVGPVNNPRTAFYVRGFVNGDPIR